MIFMNTMKAKMSMLSEENREQNYKYKLEKAERKYSNTLTVGNGITGDFLFYTYLYFPKCLQVHITFIAKNFFENQSTTNQFNIKTRRHLKTIDPCSKRT